jgi:hypothetical protein
MGTDWMGRLPGDIRVEHGNTGFYFPIVTCIIISGVLSVTVILRSALNVIVSESVALLLAVFGSGTSEEALTVAVFSLFRR